MEVALCERFGWTWQELDEQDEARVMAAVGAANVRDALLAVERWTLAKGRGADPAPLPPATWRLWQAAQAAYKAHKDITP